MHTHPCPLAIVAVCGLSYASPAFAQLTLPSNLHVAPVYRELVESMADQSRTDRLERGANPRVSCDQLGFTRTATVPDASPYLLAVVQSGPVEIFFNAVHPGDRKLTPLLRRARAVPEAAARTAA